MSFHTVAGQDKAKRILQHALQRDTVSHAYLFSGPPGTGRKQLALAFAKALLCERAADDACGACLSCRKFEHGNQPSLLQLAPDGATIKIEQIRQLQRDLGYRSAGEGRKVYILEQAETMTLPAANSLLKFLEEPQAQIVAILIADNGQAVLPTIRSRTQWVPFAPPAPAELLEQLVADGHSPVLARAAIHLASGYEACAAIIQEETFAETRNVVIQLGKESLTRFTAAMITSQQQVFKANAEQRFAHLLPLLLLWYKDMIHFQAGRQESIVFIDQLEWMGQHAYARTPAGWVSCMERALEAQTRIRAHVAPQLAFEQMMIHLQEG
ncbi:DNA polymerase III subunit delta' [Paenibacillus sp. IB182496]|uniref:DNA polymerase III subunit delta n=1 Tax=Paenibacillus sabuli TaxID=2772509 RepID=A0A927BXT6_9BACL|nr:DNA polymerase III subunit delta' [Paenibacillus sabuli]MBD2848332.1 DNA polymerase III subunit delta' [Paenibacillus sabuli]